MIDYLDRIYERLITDDSIYVYGFILFEKAIMKNSYNMKIMNFHKLIFIATMIAHKLHDDFGIRLIFRMLQ